MRYALLSDIHSNLEALTATLEELKLLSIDQIISMGDLVGYNANPNECLDIIKENNILSVMGNHDSRAVGMVSAHNFNSVAKKAIKWTASTLTEENSLYLKYLPYTLDLDNIKVCHGWLNSFDKYILDTLDAKENFDLSGDDKKVTLFGHTHLPCVYVSSSNGVEFIEKSEVDIIEGSKYLINPGSVGQPRDGDSRASFAVLEINDHGIGKVEFKRVRYDIDLTAEKIKKAGLPEALAKRLVIGR